MIIVDDITIVDFRGIRTLTLNFKGKNFAVCGPNGTGKSGVVDALEFGLTGNISRLAGEGTGEVSLKRHAPHVDSRDCPEKATVTLNLRIPSLSNIRVRLERNVRDAYSPRVSPNTPEVLEVLNQLQTHPEIVLSRREIIAYVLAKPGKRSEEIQALLRLDQVGKVRSTLKSISNECSKEAQTLKKVAIGAREHLTCALEISEFNKTTLLKAINTRRAILQLAPIEMLAATTSLDDGAKTSTKSIFPSKVNKSEVIADIKRVRESLTKLTCDETRIECEELHRQVSALSADPLIADSVSREQFLRTAITFISDAVCPVCDTEWDIEALRKRVETKLERHKAAAMLRAALETRLGAIIETLEELSSAIAVMEKHSKVLAPENAAHFIVYRTAVGSKTTALKNVSALVASPSLMDDITDVSAEIGSAIAAVESAVVSIPDPGQEEAARDYLILCQDRFETYLNATRKAKRAEEHAGLALMVHDVYAEESAKVLEEVYKTVEEEFSGFYRAINSEDEEAFTAKLTPSMGKLGFDVDFYGRGHFPPGAYHSEGHQDGMGVCLYLALMQRLQGKNFTFAVLDDVLMSVDTGHRREVCTLLKKHFPHTQFVLTTHDEVWLKHMVSAGLIGSTNAVRFSNWTPDHGPTEWNRRDIWAEIETALKEGEGDVHTAASNLRYYLEYIFKEICHNLRAQVVYRGDGRNDLGDVLPPAVRRFRDLLLEGKKAGESWNRVDEARALEEREKTLADSLRASNAEQWQINPAVHYNEWANLTAADFAQVVKAFHDLVQTFICNKDGCKGLYYLTGRPGNRPDTLRCVCGETNISLNKR